MGGLTLFRDDVTILVLAKIGVGSSKLVEMMVTERWRLCRCDKQGCEPFRPRVSMTRGCKVRAQTASSCHSGERLYAKTLGASPLQLTRQSSVRCGLADYRLLHYNFRKVDAIIRLV
jgi:hypothetical protein